MKALYLSTFEIAKKWTMSIHNWGKVRGELEMEEYDIQSAEDI